MGVDCKVRVGDIDTLLDRWYIFSPRISAATVMTKQEALLKLKQLSMKEALKSETKMWENRQAEFIKSHKHWIAIARNAIKKGNSDRILFYTDN